MIEKFDTLIRGLYRDRFDISDAVCERIASAEAQLSERFQAVERIKAFNQIRMLTAFQNSGLAQSDFYSTTGYGYGDVGRDKTEAIFRDYFKAEDAIVRPSISSGTHALATVLFALLCHGDAMLAVTGHPYDTLMEAIGIQGDAVGTLTERGISYSCCPLTSGGKIDYDRLDALLRATSYRLVELQRSTGYSDRCAFTIDELEEAVRFIRQRSPEAIIMVDNCYGEFTEAREPIEVGADIIAGSLIKNPGGGIAVSGGYIAGKSDMIERCMNHLTAPGLGKHTGLTFNTTRLTLQGFFMGPHITAEAMKAALLFGQVFSSEGFEITPTMKDARSDIIQAIKLGDPDYVIAFCRAIQRAASVGSTVVPYPWDMPGYTDRVIMASGGFIDGSSIEISADGPLREPFFVYYQGGIVYDQAKLACLMALEAIEKIRKNA